MRTPLPIDELLSDMGRERRSSEPPYARRERRTRVVGAMRELHVELLQQRAGRLRFRKRGSVLLVAASLTLSGIAFAGATGHGPLAGWFANQERPRSPAGAIPPRTPAPAVEARARLEHSTTAPASGPVNLPARPAAAVSASAAPQAVRKPGGSPVASAASGTRELEAVNQLFADAKRARREHRDAEALLLLQELLAKYPRSLLAQEASVERFRALARMGRASEASRFARRYLEHYPRGFAFEEARALVGRAEAP